ncbi:MAG: beta-ketoacyl synthase N-terminal-like domain-containing protein [Gammaproteobacteria bacterium]|nr:beta-ketoacyl synthase N-terminal-like domain-containing protein [Gammaproteobacteria bacterium]
MEQVELKSNHFVFVVQNWAAQLPNQMAYTFLDDAKKAKVQLTYAELDKKARAIAAYLQQKNIFSQRVLVLYSTGLEFISAFLGCLYAGAIAVPVNAPAPAELARSRDLLNAIAEDADISCILTESAYLEPLKEHLADILMAKSVAVIDSSMIDLNDGSRYVLPDLEDETVAYLQYTSGSTSTPKGVMTSHKNLAHSLTFTAEAWHYSKESITLTWAPHSHVYGLVCGLLLPLYHGTPAYIMRPAAFIRHPASWLQAISTYRVTHSGCPNFGYDLCVQEIDTSELNGVNLKRWLVAVNGGESVQYQTLQKFMQKFEAFGFKPNHFNSAYGMSEMTGLIASTQYDAEPDFFDVTLDDLKSNKVVLATKNSVFRKFVSSGDRLPGLEAVIVDPDTLLQVSEDGIGEIWLAGDSVASGYFRRPFETKNAFGFTLPTSENRYFRTGDLGFIRDGDLCITGRLKEVIVIHGKKYYPLDIETTVATALDALPVHLYRVAFSLSIQNNEEVIFLQEVKEDVSEATQDEIINLIRRAVVARFGIDLHTVVLVKSNSLPKTASGKLQRKVCQQFFEENKLNIIKSHVGALKQEKISHPADHDAGRFQMDFLSLAAAVLKIDASQIHINDAVSAYHFDSINLIQLTNQLNEKFQLSLTPAILFEFTTLKEFVDGLLSKNSHAINHYYQLQNPVSDHTIKTDSIEIANIALSLPDNKKPIAVIGMSGIFPGASNVEAFWQNLVEGIDAISEIPQDRWNWKQYEGDPQVEANKTNIRWGGFVDDISQFDATFFNISPREAEMIDPQQRLFLQTALAAIEDAGITTTALAKVKTGLFVGAFSNDYAELLHQNGITDAYTTTGLIHSILANRVSYLLNLRGPSEAIDTACSSSLVALHHAVQAIQSGDCDVAIVGGVNALVTPSSYLSASKAGMLSEDGRCKTFDSQANGYVRSEGIAAIVLKSLAQAEKDGDHIYGVIKGSAVNHGGNVSSLTVPNPNAQAEVIMTACRRAGVSPATISLIETHGTGTSLGDPIEINGLKKAFSELGDASSQMNHYCGLGAVKSNIGHLESAAGMAGIIKVLLAMKHQKIPGNLHFNELNPYIELDNSPFYIVSKTKRWDRLKDQSGKEIPNRAGVSSFGFGGTNAHIILEEYVAPMFTAFNEGAFPYLIAISAKTESVLINKIQDLKQWLDKQEKLPSLSAVSFTLNQGRNHFAFRSAFVVGSIQGLKNQLEEFLLTKKVHNKIQTSDTPSLNETAFNALVSTLSNAENKLANTYKTQLENLSLYYLQGYDLPWEKLYFAEQSRISMPTYPFAKEHYWVVTPSLPEWVENKIPVTQQSSIKPQKRLLLSGNAIEFIQEDFIQQASQLLKIPPNQMDISASLTELGFDSIALKELAVKLEKHYSIQLTPSVFFTHKSIKAITQYLLENYPTEIMRVYAPVEAAWVDALPSDEANGLKTQNNQHESIAVIGMQGLLPQSNNVTEFWDHIEAGHDLVGEVPLTRWDWRNNFGDAKQDTSKTNSKWGGVIQDVDKFDASFFKISAREANLMDPQQRLFMEIVWKTIEDAGYDPESLSNKSVGLFAGVEFSEYQTLIHAHKNIFHGHVATGNSHAMLANRISYFLNLHGPSEVVDTACSSSLVAVNRAVNALHNGECEVAIAGGVSLMLDPDTFVITSQLGALSPDGRCKTFDKSANGYVKGEGVVALMLKPLSQAEKDGDTIYGVIKATSVNHGGKTQSLTAPDAASQSQLLIKAYRQAGFEPQTVTYIEAHGTGTELGDPIEIEGLKQAFKTLLAERHLDTNPSNFCGIGSVKTNIGHLEPASGIAGMIKVLLAMQHGKIPGNLHFNEQNPFIDLTNSPFYIVQQTQEWSRLKDANHNDIPRRAGVSSFGFGGTNAHVVLEESRIPSNTDQSAKMHKPHYLITLSAKTTESLQQKIVDLYEWLKHHFSKTHLEPLSFTLNTGRTHFNVRCAIVVNSLDELLQSLQSLLDGSPLTNCLMSGNQSANLVGPVFDEVYRSTLDVIKNYVTDAPQVYREKLLILADLFTKNYNIDWQAIHVNESRQRIAGLPAYPFIKQHYWFDAEFCAAPDAKPISIPIPQVMPVARLKTAVDLQDFTQHYLIQVFAEKLRINPDQIAINETYEVYGVDSMLGLEITNRLEEDFGTLSKTLLYERSNISDLAAYFMQKHKDKVQWQFANANPATDALLVENVQNEVAIKTIEDKPQSLSGREGAMSELVGDGDIAIIGLSGVYPMANDINAFWDNLVHGKDCVGEVPIERWDYKDYPVKVGDEVKYFKDGGFLPDVDKFDPLFFNIAPRDAALMDPQERLFMQTCWATLEDAGYTRDALQQKVNNQVGVFAGVTYNFYPLFIFEEWQKGNRIPLDIQSFSIANRISYFLNLKGPSYVIDTACSSSLAAIHLACESIVRGECVMAIAGGVNLSLHPAKYHMLGSYSFMSDQGRCASFAEGGAGYVPSEGVGAVLLKPLALAIKDNDRIYGVIKSSAMNHGGKTSGYTVPNPNAQTDLIKSALKRANINPRSISYIEAHGTGTSLGDPIEIRGLQDAFEETTQDKQFCAIGSVKSNIGHLESAAGISQLTKVLLQMQHKKLVPSLHAEKLNPFIDFEQSPFYVQQQLSDWQPVSGFPRRAGVSSFGAGGTNVHLIVDEYIPPVAENNIVPAGTFLFILSALNADRLQAYANEMQAFLSKENAISASESAMRKRLNEITYMLQMGREPMTARLAIVTTSFADLIEKLQSYIDAPTASGHQLWFNHSAGLNGKMPDEKLSTLMQAGQLNEVAKSWIDGAKINWNALYPNQKPNRVYLPSYPFAKRRCWVPTLNTESVAPKIIEKPILTESTTVAFSPAVAEVEIAYEMVKGETIESADFANDWFYTTAWEPKPIEDVAIIKNPADRWLVFSDKELGFLLQHELGISTCLYNFMGEEFDELNSNAFYINPAQAGDYNQLLARVLAEQGANLKGIIYLWPLSDESPETENSFKLLSTFQALAQQHWKTKLQFCLVTRGAQSVETTDPMDVCQRHLWSMARIFGVEQPDFQMQLIDLNPQKNLRDDAKYIATEVMHLRHEDNHVAYRHNTRYVNRLKQWIPTSERSIAWQAPETALITGGLGALGTEVAKMLAMRGTKHLLLIGRSELPELEKWKDLQEESLLQKTANLIAIQKLGVDVRYVVVDVTDKLKMQTAITETERLWNKPIQGVFHLAGLTTENITIAKMSPEILKRALDTKIYGALHLHELFQKTDLNCFVMFSSLAAVPFFGLSGLVADAAGNEFLDALAAERHHLGLPALTINWSAWSDIGMSHQFNHAAFLSAVGLKAIPVSQGLPMLQYLLSTPLQNVVVMNVNWQKFFQVNTEIRKLQFFNAFFDKQVESAPRQTQHEPVSRDHLTALLLNAAAKLLDLDVTELELDVPFQNYGMDSIIGINFIAEINEHFPDAVSPMDLYRYPTLSQLVGYLIELTQPESEAVAEPVKMTLLETPDEDAFLVDIAHLDDEQVRQLLENELSAIDNWH